MTRQTEWTWYRIHCALTAEHIHFSRQNPPRTHGNGQQRTTQSIHLGNPPIQLVLVVLETPQVDHFEPLGVRIPGLECPIILVLPCLLANGLPELPASRQEHGADFRTDIHCVALVHLAERIKEEEDVDDSMYRQLSPNHKI
jgi:hypothetical protein